MLGGVGLRELADQILDVDAPPPVDFQERVARVFVGSARRGDARVVQSA